MTKDLPKNFQGSSRQINNQKNDYRGENLKNKQDEMQITCTS